MKKDIIQKSLTIISFLLPTILLGIFVFSTFFLPNEIAIHFDDSWNVNRYGGQYELLLLGLTIYLIPMIMALIFVNVKAFTSKFIGLISSICVSIIFLVVFTITLTKVIENSSKATLNTELWVAFALTIVGFACIIASHILPFVKKNIILRKQDILLMKNTELNKLNVVFSVFVFLFGLTVCIGCSVLKNYYSFIVFFVSMAIFSAICYLAIRRIFRKKNDLHIIESD